MQSPTVPHKSLACLRDLKPLYEALTIEDVYHVYNALKLDDANIFTCVGTSGESWLYLTRCLDLSAKIYFLICLPLQNPLIHNLWPSTK